MTGYGGCKGGCAGGSCYGAGSASYGRGSGATSYGTGSSYGRGTASYGSGNRSSAYGSNTQMYGKLGASSIYAQNSGKPAGLYGKSQGLNTKNGLYSTSGGMSPFLMGLMKGYQNAKNNTDGTKPYKTAPRPDQPDQKYNPGKDNQDPREDEHKCPRCGGFSLFGAVCPPCK